MNLDHDFFQVSKLSEDPKKRSSPKLEGFFSPISSENQSSNADQSQTIGGGDADVDHTQFTGGIYPPSPPGFGTPAASSCEYM